MHTQVRGPRILGITNNDDASACMVVDGNIAAAAQEERFTRIKAHKTWPQHAVEYVLEETQTNLRDIDVLAYGWSAGFDAESHLLAYVDRLFQVAQNDISEWKYFRKRILDEIENDRNTRNEFLRFSRSRSFAGRTLLIDHHDAHAMGAFLCSPYDDSIVMTCDGRGDFQSLTVSECDCDGRRVLQREISIDSIGYFYGRITRLLGFRPNRHEGKVTGLAAFGNPLPCRPLMERMIKLNDSRLCANCGTWYEPSYNGYSDELISAITEQNPCDVAAAAQSHLEDLLCDILAKHLVNGKGRNVCLAGGVFGNVRLNQKIRELPGVRSVFVLPCMGDGGLSLAAAVTASFRLYQQRPSLTTMALGPTGEIFTIQCNLEKSDLVCRSVKGISSLSEYLRKDKVVGVVRGRMEFGPRALCNRSILYHAHDQTLNDWLNKRLRRNEFMPFAPVTAENLAPLCYKGWRPSDICARYMTMTYDCTDLMRRTCPATVHVDGTARPQIVRAQDDAEMFELLNDWHNRTGEPSLVNTSFNCHEEPIVKSSADALKALQTGVVDALMLGDELLVETNGTHAFDKSQISA